MPFIPASAALTCSWLRAASALALRMRLPKPRARMTALVVAMLGVSRVVNVGNALRGRALAAHHHTRIAEALAHRAEVGARSSPAELVHVREQWSVGPQCGELLEEQRHLPVVAQHVRRKILETSVFCHQPRRGLRADAGETGLSVRSVAHESEIVRNERGLDAELVSHDVRLPNLAAAAIDLPHAIAGHALREILAGLPEPHLLYAFVSSTGVRLRGDGPVVFQIGHRPDGDAHCGASLLERLEF